MIRGLYTAAAGMLASSIGTDTMANNLANVNSTGFKANRINYQSFPEMLLSRMSSTGKTPIGGIMTGSAVHDSFVDFKPGALRETGNPYDVALQGDGFFTVRDSVSGDEFYTRAGNFTVNQQGFLATMSGDLVMGQDDNGILIPPNNNGRVVIGQGGDVNVNGVAIGRLKLTRFADNQTLQKVGDTKFAATEATVPLDHALGLSVHQGRLEQSNTNPIGELVNNIQGVRLYEALQKNIQISNQTLQKAVNEVGRYR